MNKNYLYLILFIGLIIGTSNVMGACVTPQIAQTNGSMNISSNIVLCTGVYNFSKNDSQAYGISHIIFLFQGNGGTLDCNGSTIINNNNSVLTVFIENNNINLKNCIFSGTPKTTVVFGGGKNSTISYSYFNDTPSNTGRISIADPARNAIVQYSNFSSGSIADISVSNANDSIIDNNNFVNNSLNNINFNSGGINNTVSNNLCINDLGNCVKNTGTANNTLFHNTFITHKPNVLINYGTSNINGQRVINNTLIGNISLLQINGSNNLVFTGNNCTGNESKSYGCIQLNSVTNSQITNNDFINGMSGIYIATSENVSITGNHITKGDKGIDGYVCKNITIMYNNFDDVTAFYDLYDLPVAFTRSNNINTSFNNFTKVFTTAIWYQGLTGSSIQNNTINYLSLAEKKTYQSISNIWTHTYNSSDDYMDSAGIVISPFYKSYTTYLPCDGNFNFNSTCLDPLNSSGISIYGNIFDSDTQEFMKVQASTNINSDYTDYDSATNWFRQFNPFSNTSGYIKHYISNNYNNLTMLGLRGENNGSISAGYEFTSAPIYYTISKTLLTFQLNKDIRINWSTGLINSTTNIIVYNALDYYPYNNIINTSNNVILVSNISNYTINLIKDQSITISDSGVIVNFSIVSGGVSPNGQVKVIILGNNDALFANYSIQLQDSSYNLVSFYVTNNASQNVTFSSLLGGNYYIKVVEQDQNNNFNYVNSLAFSITPTSGNGNSGVSCNIAAGNMITALGEFPNWFLLMAIVLAAGVVVGLTIYGFKENNMSINFDIETFMPMIIPIIIAIIIIVLGIIILSSMC